MSKLSKIGLAIKLGFLFGFLFAAAKIAIVCIYGYYKLDLSYSGAFYYSWRVEHVDSEIAKSTYIGAKRNQYPRKTSEFTTKYIDTVQYEGLQSENLYPLYSYGIPDTFIFEKDTWKIFTDLPSDQMDLEYSFLIMRAELIQKFLNIKSVKLDRDGKMVKLKNTEKYFPFGKLSKKEIDGFFAARTDLFKRVYEQMNVIMKKVVNEEAGYNLVITKKTVTMTPSFEADVMTLVKLIFEGTSLDVTPEMVNGFWTRLGAVHPKPFDLHIMNRIYYFILYSSMSIEFTDDMLTKEMAKLKAVVDELDALLEDKRDSKGKVEKDFEDKERKLINKRTKLNQKKMEEFFKELSFLVGRLYGGESPIISKDRKFNYFYSFGYPEVVTESKEDKYRNKTLGDAIVERYSS